MNKSNLEIIPIFYKERWKEIVTSFSTCDIYYLPEYILSSQFSKDEKPFLIYFIGLNGMSLCYVVIESDIAKCDKFVGRLEAGLLFDWSTPYGYGGPIVNNFNNDDMKDFNSLLADYCYEKKIVSEFIRFHPLYQNQKYVESVVTLNGLKETVYIDLTDVDTIRHNMTSKNRNMVRKAEKSGITIEFDERCEKLNQFYTLYIDTMERNSASTYFYFPLSYFYNLFETLKDHCMLVHAYKEGEIVSSSIILCYGNTLHYHLSGADRNYLSFAPNNLLLTSVATWGVEHGYTIFHLGGGTEANDSLFKFKKSFNRNGVLQFFIGSNIFCKDEYKYLLDLRKKIDNNFNYQNNRMIKYRAGERI